MPNPSTIAADLHADLEAHRRTYHDLRFSKATRETALGFIRELEAELDLPQDQRTPNHNGHPGGKHEASPTDDTVALRLTEEELSLLKRAAYYARDVAFLTVGDKEHPAVKTWERLLLKL